MFVSRRAATRCMDNEEGFSFMQTGTWSAPDQAVAPHRQTSACRVLLAGLRAVVVPPASAHMIGDLRMITLALVSFCREPSVGQSATAAPPASVQQ